MNEYVSPGSLCKVQVQMDLCASAIEDVACEMGVAASELVLFCPRAYAPQMRKIVEETGCAFILVPNEIVKDLDHWAVHHKDRHEFGMWSEGV
jgi:hypothetical protein